MDANSKFTTLVKAGFIAIFGAVITVILFYNREFQYNKMILFPLILVCFLLILAGFLFLEKKLPPNFFKQNKYKLLLATVFIVFIIQSIFGYFTYQTVDHDIGKVFNGAILYVNNPTHPDYYQYANYMNHWTNNTGIFMFFILLVKMLNAIGFSNYYLAAVLVGQLFFSLAITYTFLYLDKTFNHKVACISLFFWLSFPVVYLQSAAFYTDTYSIAFVPMVLYYITVAKRQEKMPKCISYACITGFLLFCGMQMKATVMFVVVAWCIESLFCPQKKKAVLILACLLVTYTGLQCVATKAKYHTVLNPELVEKTDTPTVFWIMMGLSGENGEYNYMDEDAIRYIPTQKEKKQYCYQMIQTRLQEKGIAGTADFMLMKASRTFGCGDADIDYMMSRGPIYPNRWIYQFILPEGSYYFLFNNINQTIYVVINLFMLIGAILGLKDKNKQLNTPYIALGGFVIFMLLWESNHRQLVNQWPLYIMGAALGVYYLILEIKHKIAHKIK